MTATTETTDITVVSGPTSPGTASDWQLFFARRALATLKARLGLEDYWTCSSPTSPPRPKP